MFSRSIFVSHVHEDWHTGYVVVGKGEADLKAKVLDRHELCQQLVGQPDMRAAALSQAAEHQS